MKPIPIIHVDAFTDRIFGGNPAAVCITNTSLPEILMQQIAAEMNLSETAFVVNKGDTFHLRWFTPVAEVELCGHATLATAHVLWEKEVLNTDAQAVFDTLSGKLTADYKDSFIVLDFPAKPVKKANLPGITQIFGDAKVTHVAKSEYDYLIEISSEAELLKLTPDFSQMAKTSARGFIVTAQPDSNQAYDYISRFFAPACGINEDPVTGSAHCSLAPYWAAKLGKTQLRGYQASARGGYVGTDLHGQRVKLKGKAVTVMQAEMVLSTIS